MAQNEALFREVNERVQEVADDLDLDNVRECALPSQTKRGLVRGGRIGTERAGKMGHPAH